MAIATHTVRHDPSWADGDAGTAPLDAACNEVDWLLSFRDELRNDCSVAQAAYAAALALADRTAGDEADVFLAPMRKLVVRLEARYMQLDMFPTGC